MKPIPCKAPRVRHLRSSPRGCSPQSGYARPAGPAGPGWCWSRDLDGASARPADDMLARTARVMSVPADCHSLPSVAWHIVATRAVRPERISVRKRKDSAALPSARQLSRLAQCCAFVLNRVIPCSNGAGQRSECTVGLDLGSVRVERRCI